MSMKIVQLNDDCLLEISKYLTLQDQVSLFSTCRRFESVLSHIWQTKYRNIGDEALYQLSDENLCTLMGILCETMDHYKWEGAWNILRRSNLIKKFVFPRVNELQTLRGFMNMVDVAKMFPNVKKIVVDHPIMTLDLIHFKSLQQVTFIGVEIQCEGLKLVLTELPIKSLSICTCVNSANPGMYCTSSCILIGKLWLEKDLPYLESIYLGSDDLPTFPTTTIKHMTNLKELVITNFTNSSNIKAMFVTLSEHKPLTAIDIFNIRDSSIFTAQLPKVNLRRLVFYQMSDWTVFESILEFMGTHKTIQVVEFDSTISGEDQKNIFQQFLENIKKVNIQISKYTLQNERLYLKIVPRTE